MKTVRNATRTGWLLTLMLGLGIVPAATRGQPPAPEKKADAKDGDKPAPLPVAGPTLSLQECIAIALERQPNIRAAKASLAASQAGVTALQKIHPWTTVLAPDLPVRREQAARGLIVGQADVQKAEQEAVYDVTRLYYTFVYARQQEATATDIIGQLQTYYEIAKGIVEAGTDLQNVNQGTLYVIEGAITLARTRRIPATVGQPQALAALKEAMGVEQSFEFTPRDTELPVMGGDVTRDHVVSLAQSRRPELAMAAAGVDAFRLEVCAQDARRFGRTVPTLASGTDLHARLIPVPVRNGEYRPGALAPEMPTSLVGRREDRVARALEYSARQDALYEKTHNLVTLEAVNAFYTWQGTAERVKLAHQKFETSKKLGELNEKNIGNAKKIAEVITNAVMVGQWQAEYVEAVYEHLKALAALERVTAGGVKAAFPQK